MPADAMRGKPLLEIVRPPAGRASNGAAKHQYDALARDEELIEGLANGDESALALLYDRYADSVYTILVRILVDREVAEDLLQEAFLRAWKHARTYECSRGSVRCWLRGIAHNLAINELRRQRRRPRPANGATPENGLAEIELRADGRPGPEEMTCSAIRDEELARLVEQLPPADRVVVELYAIGFSQAQIAARLGQPLGTVKSRMRRSLLHLRGAAERLGIGDD